MSLSKTLLMALICELHYTLAQHLLFVKAKAPLVAFELHNNLSGGDTPLVRLKRGLKALEALPDHMGGWRTPIFSSR